ncbi:Adenylate-forming reductase Nps10 [Fusarium oxysporum f. sp. albedinis]|nr:Adenylate-forming reductase Nps10 [Fusarium oxysporum f. sp. albedinis]
MSPPTVTLAAFIQCQRLLGQCASNDITHHDPITRRLEKQPYQHRIKSTQFNSTCILHQKPQPSEVTRHLHPRIAPALLSINHRSVHLPLPDCLCKSPLRTLGSTPCTRCTTIVQSLRHLE